MLVLLLDPTSELERLLVTTREDPGGKEDGESTGRGRGVVTTEEVAENVAG